MTQKRINGDDSDSSPSQTPRKQSRLTLFTNSPSSSPTFNNGTCNGSGSSSLTNGLVTNLGYAKSNASNPQLWLQDLANFASSLASASTPAPTSLAPGAGGGSTSFYSISDVWIPPKAEEIDIGTRFINPLLGLLDSPRNGFTTNGTGLATINGNGNTNGFDEATSDATSRSETSTPQQKNSFCATNSSSAAPGHPATMFTSTKCQMCDISFESPNELQIHFQSEHISIRDGSYFSCPNSNCGKVYPSKDSLKTHLLGHYRPGTTQTANFMTPSSAVISINDQDEFAPVINQSAMSPSDLLSNGGAASPAVTNRKSSKTAHTAPKHSPGAPEETHTISGVIIKQEPSSTIGIKKEVSMGFRWETFFRGGTSK